MSPFKSQAQRRKFYELAKQGKISQKTVKKWEDETPKGKKLPEHIKKQLRRWKILVGINKSASVDMN